MNFNITHPVTARDQNSLSRKHLILISILLALTVYVVSGIPYMVAYNNVPEGYVFNGQLVYTPDQNMYFSFIRQSADEHIFFLNRLTHIDHKPVFFNLEWLLVGRVMSAFNNSTNVAYEVWRASGIAAIIFAFSVLSNLILRSRTQYYVAMFMCAFGGGFGWFFHALKPLKLTPFIRFGDLDLWAGFHPFIQMMYNPHFSLPLGLFILSFAAYIKGEQSGEKRWYWLCGIIALMEGMMRPYDLIALYAIIPFYILTQILFKKEVAFRRIVLLALPLIIIMPLFLYNVYLFYLNPVFKYWGSQGVVQIRLPLHWHILNLGLGGLLCLIRLCLIKKYPIYNEEQVLLSWLISVFLLFHAYKFISFAPYSFQLSTTLMPPIILLGVALFSRCSERWGKKLLTFSFLCAFIILNSFSSITAINIISEELTHDPLAKTPKHMVHFIPAAEMESFRWLNRQGRETDIVLCTQDTGNFLAKYASVRVVLGHWSVTPMIEDMTKKVDHFFENKMTLEESQEFIEDLGVHWIYVGQRERKLLNIDLKTLPGVKKCFDNGDVTIYSTANKENSCGVL